MELWEPTQDSPYQGGDGTTVESTPQPVEDTEAGPGLLSTEPAEGEDEGRGREDGAGGRESSRETTQDGGPGTTAASDPENTRTFDPDGDPHETPAWTARAGGRLAG